MSARITSALRPSLALRTLVADVHLALRLLREPAVPLYVKALPFAGLVYVLSPLDFLPDIIPILGQLDDLGIAIMGLKAFLRLAPSEAVAFHRQEIAHRRPFSPMLPTGDVIDAEFRRL
jgi:uncharacterized membrane protein YkvA (DUF1232 family)